jgi:hypothetical protein
MVPRDDLPMMVRPKTIIYTTSIYSIYLGRPVLIKVYFRGSEPNVTAKVEWS